MTSKKLSIVIFLALILGSCQSPKEEKKELPPPNIIFIMTDDHAFQAISCYNDDLIQTPNIDRIAREGIRFDQGFVTNSICAPSRAVMLTGKYSHLNGLKDNGDTFDGSQVTFPKLLKKAGYQTAIVGKWHLQTDPTGFDYWNILIGQGQYYNPTMIEMGDTTNYTGYTTDVITDLALQQLEKRDTSRPFCLLYHHKAPHRNWMPKPEHIAAIEDKEFPLPGSFYDDYAARSEGAAKSDMEIADMYLTSDMKLMPEDFEGEDPNTGGMPTFNAAREMKANMDRMTQEQRDAWNAHYGPIRKEFREKELSGKELAEWKYQRYIKDYLACVASVDENIGKVLAYLDSRGLAENTIVVYTSDQGFYLGEHGWYDKRFMYEESFRTPIVMRYPAEIKGGQATDEFALNLDFAPTFLDYAGVEIPSDMQGRSLRGLAGDKKAEDWRNSVYYHYYQSGGWHSVPKHYGVRTDRYKLIHYYEIDSWELYDLEKDPTEVNNVYGQPEYQDITEELFKELKRLQQQYKVEPNS